MIDTQLADRNVAGCWNASTCWWSGSDNCTTGVLWYTAPNVSIRGHSAILVTKPRMIHRRFADLQRHIKPLRFFTMEIYLS